ncbi:type I-E CRISPR-associated protein Cas7/Cse4/CasC [Saxibacter everestensis]|uniref:Type I-E CRISPR-associated protein Cas7/Cse4/CasC n=1 Tax=Saxibacter everestensis TaxID=2909229 RepID=A0ABY8QQT7_9MICO|nr:type I-E CRISPR-associated protein Cas7/Cse4/CasC [Brevibacteriaceae bacterium ZFBP1038]
MSRTIVDIHILQTVPPSNINRDDTGSPKTAVFGGTRRARVSSQAWKRATRLAFNSRLDPKELGVRTKRIVELLADRITAQNPSIDSRQAQDLAKQAFAALGKKGIKLKKTRKSETEPLPDEAGYLVFLSGRQLDRLADAAVAANATDDPRKALKDAGLTKAIDREHSVDIALFGRMVADVTDLNVDAAAQVAHALSVHAVETEFDYYTAVDDHKNLDEEEDAGAGMIGTVEFNSSTLYRYATIDVDRLLDNLDDGQATVRAVQAFVEAFATSMPTGKQNTFANRTLPDGVVVSVRDTQSVNLVGAFEQAVEEPARLKVASRKLVEHAKNVDTSFGTTPVNSWVVRVGDATSELQDLGTTVTLPELVVQVGEVVSDRLSQGTGTTES